MFLLKLTRLRSAFSGEILKGFDPKGDNVKQALRDMAQRDVEEAEEDVRARIAQLLSSCKCRDRVQLKYTGESLSLDQAYAILQSQSRRCTVTALFRTLC